MVEKIEKIKGDIRAAVKTMALLAHNHSGPFAHQLAFEAEWLMAVLSSTDPDWQSHSKWATASTAFEYFAAFRSSAEVLGEALQATATAR